MHVRLTSELRVVQESKTHPAIKPTYGAFSKKRQHLSGFTKRSEDQTGTWEAERAVKLWRKEKREKKKAQLCLAKWQEGECCPFFLRLRQPKQGLRVTSHQQANSAGWVQVGTGVESVAVGVWFVSEWVTSCHCSLKCEFCLSWVAPSLGRSAANSWHCRFWGLKTARWKFQI